MRPLIRVPRRTAVRRLAVVCTALALASTGCSTTSTDSRAELGISVDAWEHRGAIVRSAPAELAPELADKGGDVRTIVYRSTSGPDGSETEVSGTAWLPAGDAPDGGWPVIVLGHATTGLTADCGPSTAPDLMGYGETMAIMAESGYAVVMPDYQGLGHVGPGAGGEHPYLEPRTVGYNMIDAVRAVRNEFPDTSTRWLAFGSSQGGQAAWAANELADAYGSGLELVGTVSVVPAADMSGLAALASDGTLSPGQVQAMPLIVSGLRVVHPDLVVGDYLSGAAATDVEALTSCTAPAAARKQQVAGQLSADDVRPASPAATAQLETWLRDEALPQRATSAPMMVLYGGRDELIDADWTSAALDRACDLGGRIVRREQPDRGHTDIEIGDEMYGWMNDRFAGRDAPSDCV